LVKLLMTHGPQVVGLAESVDAERNPTVQTFFFDRKLRDASVT
jgi:hypothetical protein